MNVEVVRKWVLCGILHTRTLSSAEKSNLVVLGLSSALKSWLITLPLRTYSVLLY